MSKVWVTRDDDLTAGISFWFSNVGLEMSTSTGQWVTTRGAYVEITNGYRTPSRFKRIFGFTPRKGTCKQYELTLTEIE